MSSVSRTMSEARVNRARGGVRVRLRVDALCDWVDASSPSSEPHKTSSARVHSEGHEYGELCAAMDSLGLINSPKLEEVMIYGLGRSESSGVLFMVSEVG